MIYVVPYAGLANRMRAIASVVRLSKKMKTNVCVLWGVDEYVVCPFGTLFDPMPNVQVLPLKSRIELEKKVVSSVNLKGTDAEEVKRKNLAQGFDYVILNEDIPYIKQNQPELFNKAVSENKNILIISLHALSPSKRFYQKLFIPRPDILAKINTIKQHISENTIGLHIRRTDSEKSIEFSPTELFESVVEREIKNGKNVFLATDDTEVEQLFLNKYPGKILVYATKEFNRESIEGAKDAVVDMFCLSYTSHIYGSFWSSYSKTAARLHNAKLTIIKTPE